MIFRLFWWEEPILEGCPSVSGTPCIKVKFHFICFLTTSNCIKCLINLKYTAHSQLQLSCRTLIDMTNAALSFLRAQKSTSKSRNFRLFMETEGSAPSSQQLISDRYPKLIKHTPHPLLPICFSPSTPGSSKSPFSFRFPNQNSVWISHISHPCYIPHLLW
jgi:hypothetical protein